MNTMPPASSTNEGWVFMECAKQPDWGWPELTIRIGLCEVGRHEVSASIPASADLVTSLVKLYHANETETDEGQEV